MEDEGGQARRVKHGGWAVHDRPEILTRADWQMSVGDRIALEGMLSQLKPALAIEIGTAQGGSLERIALHSVEVHAVDITDELLVRRPPNAELHVGESAVVLPGLLSRFVAEGRNVDFALVDGDHTATGVRSDLETLLDSPAVGRTVILVHDSFNPAVRDGIKAAELSSREKVAGLQLDCIPGLVIDSGPLAGQAWGGFALVIVDEDATADPLPEIEAVHPSLEPMPLRFHDAYESARRVAALLDFGVATPKGEAQQELEALRSSLSWRITKPLRVAKAFLKGRVHRGRRA